jgi:hypothetical protein
VGDRWPTDGFDFLVAGIAIKSRLLASRGGREVAEGALSPLQIFFILSAGLWVLAFVIGGNKAAIKS